jgi:hypothetical protein
VGPLNSWKSPTPLPTQIHEPEEKSPVRDGSPQLFSKDRALRLAEPSRTA